MGDFLLGGSVGSATAFFLTHWAMPSDVTLPGFVIAAVVAVILLGARMSPGPLG